MEYACLRIVPGLTKPVSESDIQTLLLASNCRRYQPLTEGIKQAISLLNTLLSNPAAPLPGNPVPVAQRHDARVTLVVEKDRMSAVAQITADWGGKYLTTEQLEQAVQASEISQGVQAPLIAAAILAAKEATPGALIKLPVALGKAAVNGQDTHFERLVETPAERILKPQELDHGRVDMRDLGTLLTVKAGAQLMRRHPATQGVPGFTVTGQELPAKHGKDSPMVAGEGTFASPDDVDLLLAGRPGLPRQEKNGMKVDDVLSVKQVDIRHGHVIFEGALIVAGDVTPGMKIKTSGDVVIGGFVEGGYIESSGTITVRSGIIGRKSEQSDEYLCHLNAQGEIHASYAQYAKLEAGGDIQIQSQLSHCYSRSGQDIKVGDSGMRKGHLLGGISIANRLIMAPILGASAYNQTRLQILGGYFTHKEQEQALRQRKQECRDQLDKLQDLLLKLLQLPGDKRNPQTVQKIKLIRTQHIDESKLLDEQLEAAQEELQKLMTEMDIIATQRVFPGVEVEMAHHHYRVDIEHGPIHFAIHEDQLQLTPYEPHK
ncbi:FapA family protein [Aeromonas bestiarum]|uniref:FapA family protein n=2 Tax=Aeromonas bestiarum TaxID=105751 RepID=A0AAW7I116_9GAMM|nr:FapA family protein [Aeromonas bestiarum]MDM5139806.1 FapA family protein [Aeromonas bestiarum]